MLYLALLLTLAAPAFAQETVAIVVALHGDGCADGRELKRVADQLLDDLRQVRRGDRGAAGRDLQLQITGASCGVGTLARLRGDNHAGVGCEDVAQGVEVRGIGAEQFELRVEK